MAATRGPAHRPLELFDGRVWPPPQLFDGRRRARLSEASHYCRPTQSSRAEAPCPEYACGPPAPRYPPGRPPALRSRPGGRREGPPGKEDYAPHNAPRQKPLTSGTGRAYSGCFPGHRDILFRVDYFPDEARPRRKGKMYSNGTLSHGLPLTRTRNPDGTGHVPRERKRSGSKHTKTTSSMLPQKNVWVRARTAAPPKGEVEFLQTRI